jgi:hypothetical protein
MDKIQNCNSCITDELQALNRPNQLRIYYNRAALSIDEPDVTFSRRAKASPDSHNQRAGPRRVSVWRWTRHTTMIYSESA